MLGTPTYAILLLLYCFQDNDDIDTAALQDIDLERNEA